MKKKKTVIVNTGAQLDQEIRKRFDTRRQFLAEIWKYGGVNIEETWLSHIISGNRGFGKGWQDCFSVFFNLWDDQRKS